MKSDLLKPVYMLLGAIGINAASIMTFTNFLSRSGGCTGSCGGACGLGCAAPLIGVAVGGTILSVGQKIYNKTLLLLRF